MVVNFTIILKYDGDIDNHCNTLSPKKCFSKLKIQIRYNHARVSHILVIQKTSIQLKTVQWK